LSNPGCDIDRLDFVMRDAASTLSSLADNTSDDYRDLEYLVDNYLQLLSGIQFLREGGQLTLCYQLRVKPILCAFARLYCKLYQQVYYCWQNTAARLMLASAVVEMLRSQKVEIEDIKPLTDIELLATLEDFEHPRVRELAHLVKYRRLYRLVRDVPLDSASETTLFSDKGDEELLKEFTDIDYVPSMMIARLPSKRVACRFADESSGSGEGTLFSQKCFDEEELARTDARLMVFQPPV
jgi:HD superfamily phosphohydrolase